MRFSEFDFDVITSPEDEPPPRRALARPKRDDTRRSPVRPEESDRGDQPERVAPS